jgi:GMP synthase (glutamine-hydrolysing)
MRVLAFRHEHGGDLGTIRLALEARGIGVECVDLYAGAALPEIDAAAGLIFMGGAMCANDDLGFLREELAIIRRAAEAGQPVLGVCLGAQLIAKALDAAVYRNAVPETGWKHIELEPIASSDPVFSRWSAGPAVFQLHWDTFELPDGAIRLARSEGAANQAFRWGRAIYGVQFHPEMTVEMVRDWSGVVGIPESADTPARCAELAGACDELIGGWSALL